MELERDQESSCRRRRVSALDIEKGNMSNQYTYSYSYVQSIGKCNPCPTSNIELNSAD
jgi:hypothetical protein